MLAVKRLGAIKVNEREERTSEFAKTSHHPVSTTALSTTFADAQWRRIRNGWLMANSRELVECVAKALDFPLTEVTGHMRHLREAGLITVGGRGITAPQMMAEDAATLICSLYGSELMKDGVTTVQGMKSLKATFQGTRSPWRRHRDDPRAYAPIELLGSRPEEGAIVALAAVLRLLRRERELVRSLPPRFEDPKLDVRFSVQYPHHFVSLTVSFCGLSEIWTFGQRGKPRTRQTRECDEGALRDIAMCLETP